MSFAKYQLFCSSLYVLSKFYDGTMLLTYLWPVSGLTLTLCLLNDDIYNANIPITMWTPG